MRLFDKFEKKWICLPIYPYSTDNLIVIHLLEQQSYLYWGYIINGMSDSTKAVKKTNRLVPLLFSILLSPSTFIEWKEIFIKINNSIDQYKL